MAFTVRVQAADIDIGQETASLRRHHAEAGALASFLGTVRSTPERPITALTLEHYPAMSQPAIEAIAADAISRFGLLGVTVIHRTGRLVPGDAIVLVLAAAQHRRAALDGCAFLIDWLKTSAPFWKKEDLPDGSAIWVEPRPEDAVAVQAWG